ncbi:MAG TPA: hypothetical protein VFF69_05550 [Phycisphaerales bacterium]|nr:hypothetical protein [Phycisphaerales bacterium]
MTMDHERLGRLERTVRRQRAAMAAMGGAAVLLLAGGQMAADTRDDGGGERAVQYAAGGDKLYRIHPSGKIEYMVMDFAAGTVEGIPDWALVHVDRELSRDRMGNVVVRRR